MNVIHGQSKISLLLAILVGVTRYYKLATHRPSAFARNKTSGKDFDSSIHVLQYKGAFHLNDEMRNTQIYF